MSRLEFPTVPLPITRIPLEKNIRLYIKREDLIHPEISGNKYWKLFYNVNHYLNKQPNDPKLITFGGAYSNHIAAVAAVGKMMHISTLGIIRGEELSLKYQENPTLKQASENGMEYLFVTREEYRNKENISLELKEKFPEALIIPEGGTNDQAVEGVRHMLNNETQEFDYLCTAVGTGGTAAGLSKFCETHQQVIGCQVVKDPSVEEKVFQLSGKRNVTFLEAHDRGYGKITEENIRFINSFFQKFGIPLDPVYTGKMMKKIMEQIEEGYFPEHSSVLVFHTGGLQGIAGANERLKQQNKTEINFRN